MVTKIIFSQDFFRFSKNGQKKCPKLKFPKYFWKRKSLKYNKSPKQLKEKGGEILNIISSII
jgi:hypothetical protein